jgi:hypothetical protein
MPSKHPLSHWLRNTWFILRNLILFALILLLVNGSAVPIGDLASQVRAYTHPMEFDFVTWTLDAFVVKLADWGFGVTHFLDPDAQTNLVREYLHQVQIVQDLTTNLTLTYTDPSVADPESAGRSLRKELTRAQARLDSLASLAETTLQSQLMDIIAESDLAVLGQVLPPSLFRATTIPYSLILSPRTEINQVLDISLQPGMTVEAMEKLEESITADLDYAALVVPIGGIGTYPTMVMQSTDLVWLTEVIAHEWVHNYLTLRPLGMNYYTTPELRTINETTASLVGEELGLLILKKYYPDWVPEEISPEIIPMDKEITEPEPAEFDYRAEMRITREEADRLLSEGKITEAETYLEARRAFFWENGYAIRKLNQAYFAFYGAYNDDPGGGAAGEDPVGPAVQAYRAQFDTLAEFLESIARVDSYEELLSMLESS